MAKVRTLSPPLLLARSRHTDILPPIRAIALAVDTHLHDLRHYSATELIAADLDVRTIADPLGHGGGTQKRGPAE